MRIAVDLGYGFTKAVSEAGKELSFPSVVGVKRSSSLGGVLGSSTEDYHITLKYGTGNEVKEESYFVGDAAMSAGGTRTWEEEAAKNRNLIVLVATAVGLLLEKDEPVQLAVGLPMAYFNSQRNSIREALQKLDVTVQLGDLQKHIVVNNVFVFPQSAGVYYSALHDINGDLKNANLFNKPVGVIDIGYRTVDILYMARGKKGLIPREEMSGSEELGMNVAHKEIQQYTMRKTRGNVELLEIEKAILWANGELPYKGSTFNISDIQKDVYESHADKILSWVKQTWGPEINYLSAIIVGGGGGDALYPYFKDLPGVMKVEKPEYANARGYLAAQALALKTTLKS